MSAKTNSDKIDELDRRHATFVGTTESELAGLEKQLDRHTGQIDKLQDTCNQILARLAAIDQRLATIEKQLEEIRGRRWQFYLLVLSSVVSVLVATLTLLLRK